MDNPTSKPVLMFAEVSFLGLRCMASNSKQTTLNKVVCYKIPCFVHNFQFGRPLSHSNSAAFSLDGLCCHGEPVATHPGRQGGEVGGVAVFFLVVEGGGFCF